MLRPDSRRTAAGVYWLQAICAALDVPAQDTFQAVMSSGFQAVLKGPFNHDARALAGMTGSLYA